MTSAVLLDHVSAYASAVRAHLADLSPEQVEDLTDGLEADLAEALEDREGPVVTGEIPIGRAAADAGIPAPPGGASMIDLTRRFGPATEYAAELRSAAGLAVPGGVGSRAPRLRRVASVRVGVDRVRRARRELVESLRASTTTSPIIGLLEAFAPLWWLVRAWSWWVLVAGLLSRYEFPEVYRFVPRGFWDWVGLLALGALSVAYGRGRGTRRWWTAGLLGAAGVVAAINLVWAVPALADEVRAARWDGGTSVRYVEVPVASETQPQVQDGVYVDGMLVSNLFVYDAAGNPLEGVQIYDDRGRQVRTMQTGWADWELPGVAETWRFVAAVDGDGRNRWNVYPLMGAPTSSWDTEGEAGPILAEGEDLRTPPLPFAKAPAVVFGTGHQPEEATGSDG